MKAQPNDDDSLERAVIGGLRSAIHAHGPITLALITSAAKRVLNNLRNARVDGLARELARRRWAGVSEEDRSEHQAAAARAGWAAMTVKQRSKEMRRRRLVGLQRRRAKPPGV